MIGEEESTQEVNSFYSNYQLCRIAIGFSAGVTSEHHRVVRSSGNADPWNLSLPVHTLEQYIEEDIQNGLIPCLCVATAGTTSTGAFDPLKELGAVSRARNVRAYFVPS